MTAPGGGHGGLQRLDCRQCRQYKRDAAQSNGRRVGVGANNPLGVAAAAAAIFVISFVWYAPLFGRARARAVGLPADHTHEGADLVRGLLLTALGAVLLAAATVLRLMA